MWHTMNLEDVKRKLKSNFETGLKESEVIRRRERYGENKLVEGKKESIFIKFIKQFNDFMIIVLIIAAIISALMSYIQHSNEYIDSIIIIVIVILNAIMGVVQENKAEKSIEALKKMSAPTAKVKREGKIKIIPSTEIVRGDIILIEAGCFVPADARLINSFNLKVEESALTGETIPVTKNAEAILKDNIPDGDMINIVFATTIVSTGHAEAIVFNTGMDTKVRKNSYNDYIGRFTGNPSSKEITEKLEKN